MVDTKTQARELAGEVLAIVISDRSHGNVGLTAKLTARLNGALVAAEQGGLERAAQECLRLFSETEDIVRRIIIAECKSAIRALKPSEK